MREGAVSKHVTRFVMYAFLIIVSFISVFPLYWAFISAFNSTQQILGGRMIPSVYLMQNLQNLFAQQDVLNAMKNSFATSLLQTFLALAVSSIAGYGFEIYHDKYKDGLMGILMLAMMVPFVAVLVPLFQFFSKLKLLNTWVGFFLPGLATPFLIMYFRNSARTFPKDTIEAARIDGLNEFQIFIRMFIPTADSTTMPMLVSNLMAGYVIDYGVVMAGVTLCSLPTVIIFFCLQKSFTNAVAGAVK